MRSLPNLLYLADVPVEASYHGSALMYRLLQDYPKERLRIIEAGAHESVPERRLQGVAYQRVPLRNARLLNTRLNKLVSSGLSLQAAVERGRLSVLTCHFKSEAVLSVAYGYSWLTAAAYARRHRLPFHLIVHDDCPRVLTGLALVRRWIDRRFGQCYKQAVSRLCVSPFMVEEYERRYGVEGKVLYPSRAADAVSFQSPPERLSESLQSLTCVFAGTINSPGYIRALQLLSEALMEVHGRLLIYGPLGPEQAAGIGLNKENVEVRGSLSSNELIGRLRDEADVLFVPMSFNLEDRANMELGFPSKLTDYTALGLPLLIYGPPYCSAVRWAKDNPRVAEVVDMEGGEMLAAALHRLADEPGHRCLLASRGIQAGEKFFSHESSLTTFYDALLTNSQR